MCVCVCFFKGSKQRGLRMPPHKTTHTRGSENDWRCDIREGHGAAPIHLHRPRTRPRLWALKATPQQADSHRAAPLLSIHSSTPPLSSRPLHICILSARGIPRGPSYKRALAHAHKQLRQLCGVLGQAPQQRNPTLTAGARRLHSACQPTNAFGESSTNTRSVAKPTDPQHPLICLS